MGMRGKDVSKCTSNFLFCAAGQLVMPLWRQGVLKGILAGFEREDHVFSFRQMESEVSLNYPISGEIGKAVEYTRKVWGSMELISETMNVDEIA